MNLKTHLSTHTVLLTCWWRFPPSPSFQWSQNSCYASLPCLLSLLPPNLGPPICGVKSLRSGVFFQSSKTPWVPFSNVLYRCSRTLAAPLMPCAAYCRFIYMGMRFCKCGDAYVRPVLMYGVFGSFLLYLGNGKPVPATWLGNTSLPSSAALVWSDVVWSFLPGRCQVRCSFCLLLQRFACRFPLSHSP